MHLRSAVALVIASCTRAALSAPVDTVQMGSKHNLYLATCTRRSLLPGCPLIIICPKSAAADIAYTAVLYYANGPVESNQSRQPTEIATVSEPAQPWDGTQRVARLGRGSSFASNINSGAEALQHGEIAGEARMDTEDFVCFRDGETRFESRNWLGLRDFSCTADYWCPSIAV